MAEEQTPSFVGGSDQDDIRVTFIQVDLPVDIWRLVLRLANQGQRNVTQWHPNELRTADEEKLAEFLRWKP